jgi:Trypsin
MRRSFLVFSVALTFVATPVVAMAVTGGLADGNRHPYVAYYDNFNTFCSGTLISPTVLVTAAHCMAGEESGIGTNSVTQAQLVAVSFDPQLAETPFPERVWYIGSYYSDPQYGSARGGVTQSTHDVAIVVFSTAGCQPPSFLPIANCGPVPSSATNGQYGNLPSAGLIDNLPNNAPLDIVGYGANTILKGSGPCSANCRPAPDYPFSRYAGTATYVSSNDFMSQEFIKFHQNDSGVCFGDSGGPELLAGTNTMISENTGVTNGGCKGVAYAERLDLAQNLSWIASTATRYGGSAQR